MVKPQGTGRRKIDIKKIEKQSYLKTTFTKRRRGLFNKAEKYCDLSGANIAILTFSSSGKPYSFGNPSSDSVINRFLNNQNSLQLHNSNDHHHDQSSSSHEEKENPPCDHNLDLELRLGFGSGALHGHCNDDVVVHQESRDNGFWWDESIEGLELHELEQFRASLLELKKNVGNRIEDMRRRDVALKDFLAKKD